MTYEEFCNTRWSVESRIKFEKQVYKVLGVDFGTNAILIKDKTIKTPCGEPYEYWLPYEDVEICCAS